MNDTTTGKLAEALAKVQAALPTVHKGKTASIQSSKGSYGYSYADLADVTTAIMPLLAKNGLAFTAHPRMAGSGGYELAATLLHSSGESITGALPIHGSTPQQWGSAITYMRRYLLGCMTGLVTDDDDDARIATEAARAARREVHQQVAEEAAPKINGEQSKKLHALLGDLGLADRDKKLKLVTWYVGREVTTTASLTSREAKGFIEYLEGRLRDQEKAAAKEQPA